MSSLMCYTLQCGRALSRVLRRRRRQLRPLRTAHVPSVTHPQTRTIHAESAATAVRHVAHHGQRGDFLLALDIVYLHIQVSEPFIC